MFARVENTQINRDRNVATTKRKVKIGKVETRDRRELLLQVAALGSSKKAPRARRRLSTSRHSYSNPELGEEDALEKARGDAQDSSRGRHRVFGCRQGAPRAHRSRDAASAATSTGVG